MWRLFTPIISGLGLAAICKPPPATQYTPPAWVFRVVWPILYLLIGLAWSQATQNTTDILLGLMVVSLNSWLILYNCLHMRLAAELNIACTIALVVGCISIHSHLPSKLSLLPLLAWLLFAQQLLLQKKS